MLGPYIRIHRLPATIVALVVFFLIFCIYNTAREDDSPRDPFDLKRSRPAPYGMVLNHHYVNLRELLIGSIQAATFGGLEILDVAHKQQLNEKSKGKTDEGANDPLTDADTRSHCVMKQGLQRLFPRISIVSEEDMQECDELPKFELDDTVFPKGANIPDMLVERKDITVWIDPLDATQEFTEQLYDYVTTMVCVAVKGVPVIGVIHKPFAQKTAWAWVDHSKSEYLDELLQYANADRKKLVITVSRSHAGEVKNLTRTLFGEDYDTISAAGAGYKVLQLASDDADIYLHITKIKKWDICAGDAIMRSFNGELTTLDGDTIDYSSGDAAVNTHGLLASRSHQAEYLAIVHDYAQARFKTIELNNNV